MLFQFQFLVKMASQRLAKSIWCALRIIFEQSPSYWRQNGANVRSPYQTQFDPPQKVELQLLLFLILSFRWSELWRPCLSSFRKTLKPLSPPCQGIEWLLSAAPACLPFHYLAWDQDCGPTVVLTARRCVRPPASQTSTSQTPVFTAGSLSRWECRHDIDYSCVTLGGQLLRCEYDCYWHGQTGGSDSVDTTVSVYSVTVTVFCWHGQFGGSDSVDTTVSVHSVTVFYWHGQTGGSDSVGTTVSVYSVTVTGMVSLEVVTLSAPLSLCTVWLFSTGMVRLEIVTLYAPLSLCTVWLFSTGMVRLEVVTL